MTIRDRWGSYIFDKIDFCTVKESLFLHSQRKSSERRNWHSSFITFYYFPTN